MFIALKIYETTLGHPSCGFRYLAGLIEKPGVIAQLPSLRLSGDPRSYIPFNDCAYTYYFDCQTNSKESAHKMLKLFLDPEFSLEFPISFPKKEKHKSLESKLYSICYAEVKFNVNYKKMQMRDWHTLIHRINHAAETVRHEAKPHPHISEIFGLFNCLKKKNKTPDNEIISKPSLKSCVLKKG